MIYKFDIRCRKISHSFLKSYMTLHREAEKYFSEGFRKGRYGGVNDGAWHMTAEDLENMNHSICYELEHLAMQEKLSDADAAKELMRRIALVGCRRGFEQYIREALKQDPRTGEYARSLKYGEELERRFDLAEEAFQAYWDDPWGDRPAKEE